MNGSDLFGHIFNRVCEHHRSADGTRINYLLRNMRCPEINRKSVLVRNRDGRWLSIKTRMSQVLWLIVFGISIGVLSKRTPFSWFQEKPLSLVSLIIFYIQIGEKWQAFNRFIKYCPFEIKYFSYTLFNTLYHFNSKKYGYNNLILLAKAKYTISELFL